MAKPKSIATTKPAKALLIAGILCIAFNLRTALAGVGPLIVHIKTDTDLSNFLVGLLTSLPLLAFGSVSTLTTVFTKRFGIGGTLFGAMVLLTFGIAMRTIDWIPALYIGTLLLGIAIAFGNVLLPGLTKYNFSENSGFITSFYTSVMALGTTVAVGISVPFAIDLLFSKNICGLWRKWN